MRRRTLTVGLFLILVGIFILEQGPQLLTPFADLTGQSTHYTKETVLLPPTLYEVPADNYSTTSVYLAGGHEFTGSLQAAGGRAVAFYIMSEGNYSLWREGRPSSPGVADLTASTENFTFTPSSSGIYYIVLQDLTNSPVVVLLNLNSSQVVVVLSPLVRYAGEMVSIFGAALAFFGLRGGGSKPKVRRSGWKCGYCGVHNNYTDTIFCSKCGRARS